MNPDLSKGGSHAEKRGTGKTGDIVRRAKARIFSGYNSRPATGSLQPVAVGATVEVTKLSKPSMERAV